MIRVRVGWLFLLAMAGLILLCGCSHSVTPAEKGKQAGARGLMNRSMADQQKFMGGSQTSPGSSSR